MDVSSNTQEIRVKNLLGLNERISPDNNPQPEHDICRGLYPSRQGLLSRLPGDKLLTIVAGEKILQICQTNDGSGNIIVQTDQRLLAVTLDELFHREYTPSIVYTPVTDEDAMSMALIVQQIDPADAVGGTTYNTLPGGSIMGQLSGTDTTSADDTFYPRRLNQLLINESTTVVSFVPSTAATSAAASTSENKWELSPGSYRTTIYLVFCGDGASSYGIAFGLWNVTTSAFEVFAGTSVPILGTPVKISSADSVNVVAALDCAFTVSTTNKFYQIMQKCSGHGSSQGGRFISTGGKIDLMTTANITLPSGGPEKTRQTFAVIKILKTA